MSDNTKTITQTPVPPAQPLSQIPGPVPVDGKSLIRMFTLLCTYLLYERREETTLQMAFVTLVRERHNHFHEKGRDRNSDDIPQDAWLTCQNMVCANARTILEDGRKPEASIGAMQVEMLQDYQISLTPHKDGLHAALTEPNVEAQSRIVQPTGAEVQQVLRPTPANMGKLTISE